MAMSTPAPGWQTDDLGEEWVESSPSPPPSATGSSLRQPKQTGTSTGTLSRNMGSIQAKRGSLRGLGHAPARGLPPSRSTSASDKMMAKRDISGLLSPPESEPEHEHEPAAEPAELPAGTCLVREGVDDDRGKHLVRNQSKGKDIFGALPLERMFLPPSPPQPPAPTVPTQATPGPSTYQPHQPSPSPSLSPPTPAPSMGMGVADDTPVPRRISHQYAPLQPSRLSKSITPSNVSSSFSTSAPASEAHTRDNTAAGQDDSVLQDDTAPQMEQDQTTEVYYNHGQSTTPDTSPIREEASNSGLAPHPEAAPQSEFSFVYEPPSQMQAGSPPAFDPSEISHSTVYAGRQPQSTDQQPGLRLFRSTYDTYTREHLSALVDSIAIEQSHSQSPSQSAGEASSSSRDRETTPARSDETASSDARSSKRLRLSPPSPPKRTPMRDWGAQGRSMMDKIRDIAPGSATSASRSRTSEEEQRDLEPTVEYQQSPSPTPELSVPSKNDRPTHRSNPSTTSSGYLRAAEDLMARIKNRGVSESGSNPDSPASRARQILSETDDNAFASSEAESDKFSGAKSKPKSRPGPSPRRMLRRLSASDEIQRDIEDEDRNNSGDEQYGAPPPPHGRADGMYADDLNRYVSSSTHPTCTNTGTTMSTSFVKHKGRPPPPPPANIRMIRPDDVMGIVPDRVGKMRYDQATMRWVREHGLGTVDENGESRRESEESEDVFAGMESWRDEVRSLRQDIEAETTSASEGGSGSEDGDLQPAAAAIADKTHRWSDSTDNSSEDDNDMTAQLADPEPVPAPRLYPDPPSISPPARPIPQHANTAPPIMTPGRPNSSSPAKLRSALRQPQSSTPFVNGVKKRAGWHSDLTPAPARVMDLTPGSSGAKRSVSFSDGKKHGKIVAPEILQAGPSRTLQLQRSQDASFQPSARTKRIQGVLRDMEDLSLDDATTPSKPPKQDMSSRTLQSTTAAAAEYDDDTTISQAPTARQRAHANQTILTECSFGISHDKLVQLITDVQPFEPYWETLKSIDLRNRAVDNLARLKEFLPALQEVLLDGNRLSYLSGLPSSVLNLHVANNKLSSLTSVGHLRRIEILDISNNQLDSVYQLECLTNLKELKAVGNAITDLSGIASIEGLVKLSVANNKLTSLDCGRTKWAALETLVASGNDITEVRNLQHLESLRTLDLENNNISRLTAYSAMTTMRTLRISDNDISALDMSHFPKLRTLYADGNRISRLARSDVETSRLENLSLRNQRCYNLRISRSELQPVKRLYVSGNALPADFFPAVLPNLLYLEAAACSLTSLPTSFATSLPALRILNLNYNFLTSLDGLHGMRGLRKLTVVGCRLGGKEKGIVKSLKGLTGLEELDLRMNPSTLSFYLPLFSPSPSATASASGVPDDTLPRDKSYIQPTTRLQNSVNKRIAAATQLASAPHAEWPELDAQFRRSLPDEWYGRRLLYRGLIMRACPEVHRLDGLDIGSGERRKADELMKRAGL